MLFRSLYDLLGAYADHEHKQQRQGAYTLHTPHKLFSLDEAIERIGTMFGAKGLWRSKAWVSLQELVADEKSADITTISGRSFLTSMFSASLELAKAGQIDIQQQQNFGPLYLRAQTAEGTSHDSHPAE